MSNSNELTIVDGFDADAADPSGSPIRGSTWRFIDGEYFAFKELLDVGDESYLVYDILKGWQKLEEGCPPEYLMQRKGQPKPAQPHVDEADWRPDLNGKRVHPWKWTVFIWLVNTKTGEISTFTSNTTGGHVAVRELSEQVQFMRENRRGAMPVIGLESTVMPNEFRTPRPRFSILGWRERTDAPPLLAGPKQKELTAEPNTAETQPAVKTGPVETKPATSMKPTKITKRGVTKIDVPTRNVEPPSSEEVFNDKIDF